VSVWSVVDLKASVPDVVMECCRKAALTRRAS